MLARIFWGTALGLYGLAAVQLLSGEKPVPTGLDPHFWVLLGLATFGVAMGALSHAVSTHSHPGQTSPPVHPS
jgi:hypothetical protein